MMIYEGKKRLNYKDLQTETGVGIPTLKAYTVKGIITSEKINGEAWFDESAVSRVIEWRRLNVKARGGCRPGKMPKSLKVRPADDGVQPCTEVHIMSDELAGVLPQPQEEPEPPDVEKPGVVIVEIHRGVYEQFKALCEILNTTPEKMLREFVVDQVGQHEKLVAELQRLYEERQRLIREFKRSGVVA